MTALFRKPSAAQKISANLPDEPLSVVTKVELRVEPIQFLATRMTAVGASLSFERVPTIGEARKPSTSRGDSRRVFEHAPPTGIGDLAAVRRSAASDTLGHCAGTRRGGRSRRKMLTMLSPKPGDRSEDK